MLPSHLAVNLQTIISYLLILGNKTKKSQEELKQKNS